MIRPQPAAQTPVSADAPELHGDTSAETYLVRLGLHGQVGRLRLADSLRLQRYQRVVCRTSRGIEVGQVMGPCRASENAFAASDAAIDASDGRILRRMSPEDELLWGHLQQFAGEALAACRSWLETHQETAVLLDVEPLLDGRTLYFHFLDDVDSAVQQQVDSLAKLYEEQIQQSEFAARLEKGCGPGCGTAEAENGCGSQGGCGVCRVAKLCPSANQDR